MSTPGVTVVSEALEARPAQQEVLFEASPTVVRQALDAAVARAIPVAAAFLGALYALLALAHPFVAPPGAAPALTSLALASALGLFGVWGWLRRHPAPGEHAQRWMAALAGVVLGNSAVHLALVPEPQQTTNFLVYVVGVSLLFLSRGWFATCLAAGIVCWVAIAAMAPPHPTWIHFGFAMLSASLLSLVVHEVRLRSTGRLASVLWLAEHRAQELETERRVQTELRGREARLERFNRTLLALAKSDAITQGNLEAALPEISEAAARTLEVARVGIFFYAADRARIVSADVFDDREGEHTRGLALDSAEYPRYFAAIEHNRTIAAHDVLADPRTDEFAASYLIPLGITSMIDAPIRLRGETVGVVCHEHVGPARHWAPEEAVFAGSVADFVALALLARDRAQQEREQREFESKLQEAQRLESLGVLAGGIAHDFNNLLTSILGSAELALMDIESGSSARMSVERIRRAGKRAAELTSQMLAYAGRSRVDVAPVNLSALVEEMAGLLESSIRKNATLHYELDPSLPTVEGDPTQLRQIVMNLITNASDSLGPGGGEISLRTGAMHADRAYLERCELREEVGEGDYVFLEVGDTGRGMDADTRARIFEPFFTTKSAGRGLGLAATLGIVDAHGGALRLDSEPGRGTTFRVLLPRKEMPEAAAKPRPPAPPGWKPGGLALVVDDEKDVRQVARDLLERAGYRVIVAEDGRGALARFREHADEITLAVVDLTMPDRDGAEVARELRALKPGIPVLLASGYDRNGVLGHSGELPSDFVHKPFSAAELLDAVRAAAARAAERA